MTTSSGFYGAGAGGQLADELNYPAAIQQYLSAEELLTGRLCRDCSLLVEVGCMWGRHLRWAGDRGLSYIGVDAAPEYINALKQRLARRKHPSQTFTAATCDVTCDSALQYLLEPYFKTHKLLLLFPFNSIGNMRQLRGIARQLSAISGRGASFLIATYDVTSRATEARTEYYRNCSMLNLRMRRLRWGIVFTSLQGLRSIAYNPTYMLNTFSAVGLHLHTEMLSDIGVGYYHVASGVDSTLATC